METKRCTNCHKLLRADTEICSRCGYIFADKKQITPVRNGAKRSIPPASPHRVGHYSGLHPEDQPYQSTIIAVQRPPANTVNLRGSSIHDEPTRRPLPPAHRSSETERHSQAAIPPRQLQQAQQVQVPPTMPHIPETPRMAPPLFAPHTPLPDVYMPPPPRRRFLPRGRFVPTVLAISCLLLLVASSLLAFIFINKKPTLDRQSLHVLPTQVRVTDNFTLSGNGFGVNDLINFTHDANLPLLDVNGKSLKAHADDTGAFSLQVVVPTSWQVGPHSIYALDIGKEQSVSVRTVITVEQSSLAPPLLQLASSSLDLGENAPGTVVKKTILLTNGGGRQISWQASSDQPWLTLSPSNGTFSGSTAVQVTANSGAMVPQSYAGHITFIQQGDTGHPLKLTVTMTIKAAPPANLTIAPAALTYSATTTQNPGTQTVTLQNTSSQPLDWSSTVTTGDGANWLSISPTSDHLAAHGTETVTVSVQTAQVAVGTYQGAIHFKGGTNPSVAVSLSVTAPGDLVVSPPALSFSSTGQNPASQTITVQNSGGSPLGWWVTSYTVDGANWLLPSPVSGHLEAGQTGTVSVAINVAGLHPQSYQGTITLTYGNSGLVKQVPVALTVSVPPVPAITLNQGALNFTTLAGATPAPKAFTITNTGNATLNWVAAEDQNGANFAPLSATSGSLAPTKSASILVRPNVTGAGAGVLATTITVSDSDSGSQVRVQKIAVNITIKDQAVISLSTGTMSFSQDSVVPESSQLLVITNSGTQTLNWAVQSSVPWLTADQTSGTLAPGATITIDVHCNSSGLTPGNYPATLTVSDSDSGTPVTPQTVTIALTVS